MFPCHSEWKFPPRSVEFLDFLKVKNNIFWKSLLDSKIFSWVHGNTALLQSFILTFPHELHHIPKCRLGSPLRVLTTEDFSSFAGTEGGSLYHLNIWPITNPVREQPKGENKVKMAAGLAGSKLYFCQRIMSVMHIKKQVDF